MAPAAHCAKMQRDPVNATRLPGDPKTAASAEECLPVLLWRARPDLSCESVNRSWLEFTGCPESQALGEGWSRFVHPEDLARWLDACVRAFDARTPFEIEYRLRRRDGEYRWVLDRAQPRLAADGAFLGFVGACVDIDERKRAEHALGRALERERRLRLATEEASCLKDGFLASVLQQLYTPVQSIATWAAHLRGKVPAGSDAAQALDGIEANARGHERIIASLLELSRLTGERPSAPRAARKEPLLSGVRVLVAEGDRVVRETIAMVLGVAGAQTCVAESAGEALRVLPAFRPDVLLSDVALRDGDGAMLIRAVRALPAEQGGCLRAAALTAQTQRADALRALAAGYDAQVAKPVEPVALLATVARLAQPADV